MPHIHYVDFKFFDFGPLNYHKIAQKYLDWANYCFDKNTNRVLEMGRVHSGITTYPSYGYGTALSSKRFKIVVYIVDEDALEGAGHSLFGPDGTGIAVCRAALKNETPNLIEKSILLHELGHVFGCAFGEFYKIRTIIDLTLQSPTLKVSTANPRDDYWSKRTGWLQDPMLSSAPTDPQWCRLNANVIKYGGWRGSGPPCPDLENVSLSSDYPNTKYSVYSFTKQRQFFLSNGITDNAGDLVFRWGSNQYEAVSEDQMKKIIFHTDRPVARGISIFDIQDAWVEECRKKNVWDERMLGVPYKAKI